MIQQVDLYPESLRPRYDPYNLKNICGGIVLMALLLVAHASFTHFKHRDLITHLDELRAEKLQTEEMIDTLTNIIEEKSLDEELLARKEQLTQEVASKKKLLELVKLTSIGSTKGFYQALVDLQNNHLDGVWLTEIRFEDGGNEILLRGGSRKPALIPKYLASLEKGEVLKNKGFKVMNFSRSDEGSSIVEFLLSSEELKEETALDLLAAD